MYILSTIDLVIILLYFAKLWKTLVGLPSDRTAQNFALAVTVGFLALAGVAAETAVIMLVYLNSAWAERSADGKVPTVKDLYEAVIEGAVERVRPKMMTVASTMIGLLPILWGTGTGASVMKRIAAPMIGGMVSSTILTLLVVPAIYSLVKERQLVAAARANRTEGPGRMAPSDPTVPSLA